MKTTQTKLIGLIMIFGIISISIFAWIGGGADLFKVFLKDNTQAFSPSNIESVTRSGFEEWSRRFEVSQGDGKTWKMSYPTPNDRLNTSYLVFTETEIQSLISGSRVSKKIEIGEPEYIFFIESYETISSVLYIEINNKNYLVTSNVGNGSLADLISVFNASTGSSVDDIFTDQTGESGSPECGTMDTCLVGDFVAVEGDSIKWSCVSGNETRYCVVPLVEHKEGEKCFNQRNERFNPKYCALYEPYIPDPTSYLPREPNIVDLFNNHNPRYDEKNQFDTAILPDGKTLYTVNPGHVASSLPSHVNGSYPQTDRGWWKLGMKKDEVYAIRHMTKDTYPAAVLQITRNQKTNLVVQSDNIYNISDRPGDMTGSPFSGRCNGSSSHSSTAFYFTPPGTEFAEKSWYCVIPEDTAFYINVVLKPSSYEICTPSENICTGYMYYNGLKYADSLLENGPSLTRDSPNYFPSN